MTTNFPNWSGVDTAALVVSGMLVVFATLIVIIAFIWIMGKVMKVSDGKKKTETETVSNPTAAKAPASVAAVSVENDGISDEVVAAISAAISAMMLSEGNAKPFVIRSIKRAKEARNAWNAAGVMDNTCPF